MRLLGLWTFSLGRRRRGIKGVEEVEGKGCDGGVWEERFGIRYAV